jgi:hypothetical protein
MKLAWAAIKDAEELVHSPWANLCQHILESCLEISYEIYTVDLHNKRTENIICMVCNARQPVTSVKIVSGPGAGKYSPLQILDIDEGRYDYECKPEHYRNRLQQAARV